MDSLPDVVLPATAQAEVEEQAIAEWQRLYEAVSETARACVAQEMNAVAQDLVVLFYDNLLADAQAAVFLSHELVSQRLRGSLHAWLLELFCTPEPDYPALAQRQRRIGEVHARIRVSIPLVSRGGRIIKAAFTQRLRGTSLSREALSEAQQFVAEVIDLALECMSEAYLSNAKRGVRTDEAYRLFSMGQNSSAERERQRAALLEWVQQVLMSLHTRQGSIELPTLRSSDFGLWLHHKGGAMFEGTTELPRIHAMMAQLDGGTLMALRTASESGVPLGELIQTFQEQVNDIKYLLNLLFDRIAEVDGGRDALTQLLNRRFLPSVLNREVSVALNDKATFAVLMIDVDHFKAINDSHGHDGGDAILRQIAEVLQSYSRSSDYVFRYGGEEFLMLLVDVKPDVVLQLAERLRSMVAGHPFTLSNGELLDVTVSIGMAVFDGHPDIERLIKRADSALYDAKHQGRDQVRIG